MKLASFEIGNSSTWGVIENEEAVDVGALRRDRYPDLKIHHRGPRNGVAEEI